MWPAGVMRPILPVMVTLPFWALGIISVNQTAPSGPAVMSPSWLLGVGSGNSLIVPLSSRVGVSVDPDGCDEPVVVDVPHPPNRPRRRMRSSTSMREERDGTPHILLRGHLAMAETPLVAESYVFT